MLSGSRSSRSSIRERISSEQAESFWEWVGGKEIVSSSIWMAIEQEIIVF